MIDFQISSLIEKLRGGDARTQRFKKNTLGVVAIKYSSILLELVKVPILLSYLDNEKYGVWLTIVSMVLWTNQFDFGLGAGLRYKLTESLAKNEKERCRQLVSTAYISMSLIMAGAFVLLAVLLHFLDWNKILNVSSINSEELYYTVVSVLMLFMMRFVLELVCVILNADQRTAISTMFAPIGTVLSLGCILALKYVQPNSLFFASVFMILPYVLVLFLANMYYFIRDYAYFKPSLSFFRKSTIRDIYSMGLKYFVGQFASLIVFSSSNILITQMFSPSEVGVYTTANQYFGLPTTFVAFVLLSFASPVTEAFVKKDYDWIKRMMGKIQLVGHFAVIVTLIMLMLANFVFDLWTGGRITVPGALSISMMVYAVMNVYTTPYVEFLGGVGKLQLRMWLGLFKIVTFIPAAIFMMKLWGIVGLVVATCIINTGVNGIFGYLQYKLIINGKAKGIWNR